MRWALVLASCLLSVLPGRAQQGKDGPRTVTAAGTILNEYTTLTADANAGATTITVANSGLNTNGRFAGSLASGDLVMLLQMQGATIGTNNDATYGSVTAYNNAGRYELLEVATVPSGTSITFACALTNSYTSAGRVQVIRVPRFTTLALNANTTVTAPAWAGSTGGVVALEVQGTTTLGNGAYLDVSGLGFRGGVTDPQSAFPGTFAGYRTTNAADGAEKGEGIAGYQTDYDATGRYGRGAPANGGGGGNGHNAGGGGGANVGSGTYTGTGIPNRGAGNTFDAAWNLEAANFATSSSPGGGRGGYSYSANDANATTAGPGNPAWGGDNRRNVGGFGGQPLNVASRIFFGGGGGSGDQNDGNGTAGAAGGGLVYLIAGGSVTGNSTTTSGLRADGATAAASGKDDAAGGGGGGGTIIVSGSGALSNFGTSVQGGAGGNQAVGGSTDAQTEGPGGGGGGGLILSSTALPLTSVGGAAGGTTNAPSMTEFPPNGATQGAGGLTQTFTAPASGACAVNVYTSFGTCPGAVTPGTSVSYTVTFGNSSRNTAAPNTTRTVTLPSGASVTNAGGGTVGGSTIDFGTANIPANSSQSFTFTLNAPSTAGAYNVTAATSNTAEPSYLQANNTATCTLSVTGPAPCGNPGNDGSPGAGGSNPAALTTNPNSYWPSTATQTLTAGTTTINLGPANTLGAQTNLAAGDLVLIMQVQGADINSTNTDSYGDGIAGGSANGVINNANYIAGTYEYAVVASSTTTVNGGGSITLTSGVRNGYVNAAATSTAGARTFQVVRIPQYGSLTLGGNIAATPWNGTSGGVLVLDVAGAYNPAGFSLNASGAGFRGGATQFVTIANGQNDPENPYVYQNSTTDPNQVRERKGEGTAGTPDAVSTTGANTVATGSNYPGGSSGRGAPGNAGGSGTRGKNTTNPANPGIITGNVSDSGGGGGANGGAGGRGGDSHEVVNQTPSTRKPVGGEPGAAAGAGTGRLVLGGGGGAGDNNDGTGDNNGQASAGANGGGLVLLRAGSFTGTGSVLANGSNANNTVTGDGAGGGGAGGTVLVTVTTGSLSGLTISARGGTGGSNTPSEPHGPGGGGGGGVVLLSAAATSVDVSGGAAGTTQGGTTYGAAAGVGGLAPAGATGSTATTSPIAQAPTYVLNNTSTGSTCVVDVYASFGTCPGAVTPGTPVSYTVTFGNNSSANAAPNTTRMVTLPNGANVTNTGGGTQAGNTINFGTASIPASSSQSFTFTFSQATAGTYVVTATTSTPGESSSFQTNNTASCTLSVTGATACGNPGKDGSPGAGGSNPIAALTANPNSYWPSTAAQTLTAGTTTTINLGAANAAGAQTNLTAGDLVLIMQVQGADINSTNSDSYGDGVAGGSANGVISNGNYLAGLYEYAVVASSTTTLAGGSITLTAPVRNGYVNAASTTSAGARTFQVVRIPQYGNLTLGGNLTATPWNGSSGGVLVLDVAGVYNPAGFGLNATGAGFRGGAAKVVASGTLTTSNNPYVASDDFWSKGEGTAGTPNRVSTTGSNSVNTGSNYPGVLALAGNYGRGAPGNAGGSGSRGTGNSTDSGGGGGANGGAGGRGANTFQDNNQPFGGEPGAAAAANTARLVLGGGGAAGDNNDGTGDNGGLASSGAVGGGLVLLRAGSVTNTGSIQANGNNANNSVRNDGAGGGGAGGSVVVTVASGSLSGLTIAAKGGTGGSTTPGSTNAHGPGGGGGGGVVLLSTTGATVDVSGGASGVTNLSNGTSSNWGAAAGAGGLAPAGATGSSASTALIAQSPAFTLNNTSSGSNCVADLATVLTGPTTLAAGQPTGTFTATFSNLGPAVAAGVTRQVTLPAGATVSTAQLAALNTTYGPGVTFTGGVLTFPTLTALGAYASNAVQFQFTAPTTTGATTASSAVGTNPAAFDPTTANNTSTRNLTVTPVSDVAVSLTNNGPVNAGAMGQFGVTFTNNGPSTPAAGVVGTVQLPAGLSNVTFTGVTTGVTPSYNPTTGVVTFSGTPLSSLATGAPVTTTINYTQPASGNVVASASVSTTSAEAGLTANNAASATNSTTPRFDLQTTLTGPASVVAGQEATYTVTTTNAGPSGVANAVQTVQLPTGLSSVYVTGGGSYDSNTGLVTFPATALGGGQSLSNTISFAAPTSTYNVSAAVTPNTTGAGDTNTANNATGNVSTTVTTPSGQSADVRVTLATSAATVAAGSPVTFTLVQTNDGANPASGVTTALNLAPGLTGVTVSNGGSYNSTTGIVTWPTLAAQAPGASTTYTVTANAPASGVLTGTATTGATTPDGEPSNNIATAQTTVLNASTSDVAVTLSGPTQATPGQAVSYAVTTTSSGPAAATNVATTVRIPAGLPITGPNAVTIGGSTPTSTAGTVATYANGATYNAATGVVTYPVIASLASGTSTSSAIGYVVPANGSANLLNTATVSSNTTDPNAANNAASVTTTLAPAADVAVALTGPATVVQGNPVTYGVTTTNNGLNTANSVTTTVQLPTGLTGVVVRDAQGNVLTNSATTGYNSTDGVVRYPAVSNLQPGAASAQAGTITLTAPASSTSPLQPVATATAAGTTDPNTGNNTATAVTAIQPATTAQNDLSVALSNNAATQTSGQPVTFTLTTTNATTSSSPATGVQQTVQLPAGLTTTGGAVTVSGGGSYDNNTGLVTFPTVSLSNAAGSNTLANTIVVSQAPGSGPLVATASVTGNESDPNPANNTTTNSVTITPVVDIASALSGPATAAAGQPVSYSVVTSNTGASPASGVTQTLTIPAGVTSYSLNGGAATPVSGPATITIPVPATLAAGQSVTNVVAFTAPAAGSFPYTLTATAGATGDATPANNTATQTTTLANPAPVAANVVYNPATSPLAMLANTATAAPLPALSATDPTGSIASYTVTTVPPTSQGVLALNGTPVTAGQSLTPAQAAQLTFTPNPAFVGNATFTYSATDNGGAVSNVATYTVPVQQDLPAVYTNAPVKGGAGNPYATNDPISNGFDPNGGVTNGTTVSDTGIRSAVLPSTSPAATTVGGVDYPANPANTLPAGVSLNPTTGQLFVSNASLLVPGAYQVNVTTTDVNGGVTTQPVRFVLGGAPVANNDNATTPLNTAVTIPVLTNDTPTGVSTNPTAINPATIDLDPNTPGIQQGTAGSPIAVNNGTAYVNASNQVVFTPTTGFSGPTAFVYTVSNNAGQPSNQATVAVNVTAPNPDLQVLLTASNNPSVAGQPVTLTVTSQNNGVGTATNVVPTVRIPTGLPTSGANAPQLNGAGPTGTSGGNATYANGATYNPTTGVVTFPTIVSQASGTGSNVANTVTFNTPANGPVTLTATVSDGQVDGTPANNTASLSLGVTPRTDLATTITGPTTAPQPGDLVSYAVTTTNNGPSVATGVTPTVQLPTGLSGVFVTNGGTYNPTTGVVTFPAQTLTSGQAVGNTVSFAAPAQGTVLAPTASVPTTNDPTPGNNTSTAAPLTVTAPSTQSANTNVTLAASVATAAPGTPVTYTVTVANNGPAAATGVATTVNIGPGQTVSSLPTGASYDATTGILTLPLVASLTSGTSQAVTFTVAAPANGPLTATATVGSNESDPTLGDNVATTQTTIGSTGTTTGPDVVTTLTAPAAVPAGQPLTYTLTTTNNGTAPATGVAQTVQLPTGLSGVTASNGGTYNPTTGLVTFPTVATLNPGAGNALANTVTVPQAPATGPLTAVASTSTTSPDTTPGNNTAGTSTSVTPVSDLSVALSSPASATVGQPVTYAVTTTNNGPSPASNVAPTAQLPTGLSGVTVRDAQGNVVANAYNAATGLVTLPTIGTLPAGTGNANTATITFVVPSTPQLNLAALVPAAANDPNAANNSASTATPVTAPAGSNADLVTTLTSNVPTQTAGQPVVYTLTTTNNGPAAAQNVQQTAQLPAGLTGVSVSNGGTYNPATGLVTFPATVTLNTGAGNALTNTITVNAPAAGPLVASGNSTSNNPDPTPANNSVQATPVTITPSADVATTLSGPTSAQPGAPVSYAVTTTNNGPSAAANVAPTATLPAGLSVTGASPVRINGQVPQSVSNLGVATYPDGSTYSTTSGAVTFPTIASLATGQPTTNVVSFGAPATAYTVAASSNSATTNDPNTANNTATPVVTSLANVLPVAQAVVNTAQAPQGSTAGQLAISPLAATDADGTIASYQLTSLPDPAQGVLYYNNGGTYTALTAANLVGGSSPLNLTPTQAGALRFDPATGYVGNAGFAYTATDNAGGVSNVAPYTIPVNQDNDAQYTATPAKGGSNAYVTNDVLAYVIDPNGAKYDGTGAIYNTNGTQRPNTSNGLPTSGTNAVLAPAGSGPAGNSANALPAGVSLNPTTGQLFVSDASQLPRITVATPYSVNITTTDIYGGVTTRTASFTIGANPLPVTLIAFDAHAVQNRDALLTWNTASEVNNDHFEVERSFDGTTFVKLGQVQGQGSKATATDYRFTDAGIGPKASAGQPVYYRLRQVDLNGTSTYSPVRTVSFAGSATLAVTLYPNPASLATGLDLTALPTANTYQALLLDATGRQVRQLTLGGGLVQPLDLHELASGTYTIVLTGAASNGSPARFVLRLIKE